MVATHITQTWIDDDGKLITKVIPESKIYKRTWVGLTPDDVNKSWEWSQKSSKFGWTRLETFAESLEAKLKEKNNAV